MTTFLVIALLVMPWVFIPVKGIANQFRLPQGMFLNVTFLALIFYYIKEGAKEVYSNKYLAYFSLWIFLNITAYFLIPFGTEYIVKDGGQEKWVRNFNPWILEPMIHYILGIMGAYIILSKLQLEDFIRIAKALCISGSLIAIFAILQYFGLDPLNSIATYNCGNRVSACLDNPNLVGGYLALISPFFFLFNKPKYWIGYVICLIGLYVSKAHFAQGCALVALVTWLLLKFKWNKYLIIGLVVLTLLGGIFVIHNDYLKLNNNMSGRLICWKYSFDKLKVNPLLGCGLGVYKMWEFKTYATMTGEASATPSYDGQSHTIWFNAHNDWLQYAIELGLIGIFLLLLVVVNAIRRFSYKNETGYVYFASFITFLVMMCASFPWEVPSLAVIGLLAFCGTEKL